MIRHVARQLAVQTLYQIEVGHVSRDEAVENIKWMMEGLKEEAVELTADTITPHEALQLEGHFELDDFYFELVQGVLDHQDQLDGIISANLEGWTLGRLNKVDKAILRLAAFELNFDKETPPEIIINEALELTKEFSETPDGKARSFNNKVLDKINQYLKMG